MNSDSASLQNLNDIVMPAEVAWWPLAPGWYVLVSVVLILLAYLVYRKLQQVKKNRYRVLALRELSELRQGAGTADWLQLPSLLKRAALSAWPRNDVAVKTGTVFWTARLRPINFARGRGQCWIAWPTVKPITHQATDEWMSSSMPLSSGSKTTGMK